MPFNEIFKAKVMLGDADHICSVCEKPAWLHSLRSIIKTSDITSGCKPRNSAEGSNNPLTKLKLIGVFKGIDISYEYKTLNVKNVTTLASLNHSLEMQC